MSQLTDARRAVWAAIDNWPALSLIRQKIKHERVTTGLLSAPTSADEPSGVSDFPALSIFPSVITPSWMMNQIKEHPYSLTVQIYTAGWLSIAQSETIWDAVIDALYRSKPEGAANRDTYIRQATNYHPAAYGPSRITKVMLGASQAKAIVNSFDVTLRIHKEVFN